MAPMVIDKGLPGIFSVSTVPPNPGWTWAATSADGSAPKPAGQHLAESSSLRRAGRVANQCG